MADINPKNTNKKQPVLLQVLPSMVSGGVERGTIDIAIAAQRAGFGSLVASSGGLLVKKLDENNITHVTLPLASKNPFIILKNIKKLVEVISEYEINIVHARSRAPAWSAYYAAKKTGAHFVTTFHGTYSINFPFKKFYNSIMTCGERVIAISQFIQKHIVATYSITSDRIVVIPRGVDLNYFDPEKVSVERLNRLKEKLKMNKKRQVIFLPGRLTRWKGQEYMLDALKLLENKNFYCVIAGDNKGHDDYYDELRAKISKYDLGENIIISNAVDDMPAAYMLADVVISASIRPEAFGRIATEAQAMGRPLVATNIGGSLETVINDETGFLVKPNDKNVFAETIKKALALNNDEKENMGKKAREHVKANFSLEQMCDKTLSVYRSLLDQ